MTEVEVLREELQQRLQELDELAYEIAARDTTIQALEGALRVANTDRQGTTLDLEALVEERTAWAERVVEEAEKRGAVIEELRAALDERTAWAESLLQEAERRLEIIQELQGELHAQAAKGQRAAETIEQRERAIHEVQVELDQVRLELESARSSRAWRLADWSRRFLGRSNA